MVLLLVVGAGRAGGTIALESKIAHHNPQTDAELWLQDNKTLNSTLQQNKVRGDLDIVT